MIRTEEQVQVHFKFHKGDFSPSILPGGQVFTIEAPFVIRYVGKRFRAQVIKLEPGKYQVKEPFHIFEGTTELSRWGDAVSYGDHYGPKTEYKEPVVVKV